MVGEAVRLTFTRRYDIIYQLMYMAYDRVMIIMKQEYRTVYQDGYGEYIEKKSRFLAHVRNASSEEEALEFIAAMKKKYYDARHNCYAYIIGKDSDIVRYSDDGEPSGTAGKPILEVMQKEGLSDVVVVVTRYFGGTLLGTGGLVRAYTQAAKEGIGNSVIITKKAGSRVRLATDYNGVGKLQYFLAQEQIPILSSDYSDSVVMECVLPEEACQTILNTVTELTNAKCGINIESSVCYALFEGEVLIFDN